MIIADDVQRIMAVNAMPGRKMRGQPVVFLGVIASVWIAARVLTYLPGGLAAQSGASQLQDLATASVSRPLSGRNYIMIAAAITVPAYLGERIVERHSADSRFASVGMPLAMLSPNRKSGTAFQTVFENRRVKAAVNAYDGGALRALPGIQQPRSVSISSAPLQPLAPVETLGHWSLDGWAFVRSGGASALAAGAAQYGGSQAGLVVRYTLKPGDARRAQLYARAAGALPLHGQENIDDTEIAVGLSLRPVKRIPVAVAAEQRIAVGRNAQSRPAAFAVTQIPPIALPEDFSASVYAQAGAVGLKHTQGFFDLQMIAERPVASAGRAQISAGAGLWSGGQTGPGDDIARLDIGPRVAVLLPVARGTARLALDWRQRVAGNAAPGSGPTLTLSTGF